MPAPTVTSGGTKSCSFRRPGPSTRTCSTQGWKQTRGQQSCPTGAMRAIRVSDEEMASIARDEALETMKPETKPRVYYKNLWRYTKCFIGGSVSAEANGVVDCVEGATVRLLKDGVAVAQTVTDNYGDFKFDRLDENSGDYTVEVSGAAKSNRPSRRSSAQASISARSGSEPDAKCNSIKGEFIVSAAVAAGAYLHHIELESGDPAALAEFYGRAMDMSVERKGDGWICRGPGAPDAVHQGQGQQAELRRLCLPRRRRAGDAARLCAEAEGRD